MQAKYARSRGPLGFWAWTALRSLRAWCWLTTLRRSTVSFFFGAFHFTARTGLVVKSIAPSSLA
jgi:hypothetical protein